MDHYCAFGNKIGKIKQNRASERLIDCFGAHLFVSGGGNSPKMLVYFLRFFAPVKKRKKVDRIQIRNEGIVVEFKCGVAIEQEYVK